MNKITSELLFGIGISVALIVLGCYNIVKSHMDPLATIVTLICIATLAYLIRMMIVGGKKKQ